MAIYYATKAYVLSFSEALAEELAPEGVTVTALCPGPTVTGFQARADIKDARLPRASCSMAPCQRCKEHGVADERDRRRLGARVV